MNLFVRCGVVCFISLCVMLSSIGRVKDIPLSQKPAMIPAASSPSLSLIRDKLESRE